MESTTGIIVASCLGAALVVVAVLAAVGWALYCTVARRERAMNRSAALTGSKVGGTGRPRSQNSTVEDNVAHFPNAVLEADIEIEEEAVALRRPPSASRASVMRYSREKIARMSRACSESVALDTAISFATHGDTSISALLLAVDGSGTSSPLSSRDASEKETQLSEVKALEERLRSVLPLTFKADDLKHLIGALTTDDASAIDPNALTSFKKALLGGGRTPETGDAWSKWRNVTGNCDLSSFSAAYLAFPSSRRRFLNVERDLALQEAVVLGLPSGAMLGTAAGASLQGTPWEKSPMARRSSIGGVLRDAGAKLDAEGGRGVGWRIESCESAQFLPPM